MSHSSRLSIALVVLALACGSTPDDDVPHSDASPNTDAYFEAVDPACPDTVLHALPEGGCATGTHCDVTVQFLCGPGVNYVTGPRQYSCDCSTGDWQCTLTGSGLSLNPCDAGATD